jgi:Bacteriophage lambda head decoration protein D
MAEVTDTTYSGGMRVTNYSNEKLPIFGCQYAVGTFENSDAYPVDLAIGTVMGRVSATGNILPLDTDATDGSQFPIGVLSASYTVADGDEMELSMIVGGEINQNMLVFVDPADTLSTVVDGRQLRDHLQLANIQLRTLDELSELDNQ